MRIDLNLNIPLLRASSLPGAQEQKESPADLRLQRVTQEFEALLVEQMVREMRRTVPKSELIDQQPGHELFDEMLDGEYVRLITRNGGIGLAKFMAKMMSERGVGK